MRPNEQEVIALDSRRGFTVRCAYIASRRPWYVVAAWTVLLATFIYLNVADSGKLTYSDLILPGSTSSKAKKVEDDRFGHTETIALRLISNGPPLKATGLKAKIALERISGVYVLDPWTHGEQSGALHASKGSALMLIRSSSSFYRTATEVTPKVRSILERTLPKSIDAQLASDPDVFNETVKTGVSGARRAELIAAPILLLTLLLIFRSPIAALMPLLLGFIVNICTMGLLIIAARLTTIDATVESLVPMVGLAISIDYSLLVVSRFRQELARSRSTAEAVLASSASAGRTIVCAGSVVIAGTSLIALIVPGSISRSMILAFIVVAMFSLAVVLTLLPAVQMLLGPRIDLWSISRKGSRPLLAPLVNRLVRRPGRAIVLTLPPLLLLAALGTTLKFGPIDVKFMVDGNSVREEVEAIGRVVGEGWYAPNVVLARSRNGPITTPENLAAMASFQKRLERDPDVADVIGPADMASKSKRLSKSVSNGSTQLASLDRGMGRLESGFSKLKAGLAQAAFGSETLALGTAGAFSGSKRLSDGYAQSAAGIDELSAGFASLQSGTSSLNSGIASLQGGASRLAQAASAAQSGAAALEGPASAFEAELSKSKSRLSELAQPPADAQADLENARSSFGSATAATQSDPAFQKGLSELTEALANLSGYHPQTAEQLEPYYYGLSSSIQRAKEQADVAAGQASQLAQGANELAQGLTDLSAGNDRLLAGTQRALSGSVKLKGGMERAYAGTARLDAGANELASGSLSLTSGLGRLSNGANKLNGGLVRGVKGSNALGRGLGKIHNKVSSSRRAFGGRSVNEASKLAKSGFLFMAALQAAPAEQRELAKTVLNVDRGGDTARFYVITKRAANELENGPFPRRLARSAKRLGNAMGFETYLGGRGQALNDFDSILQSRFLLVVLGLSIVSLLLLILLFRSILLAVKAVTLNLLTVGAAFGVMVLLMNTTEHVSEAGWVDVFMFFVLYGFIFVLSLDYEIFMINRMREGYAKTGDNEAAIMEGVGHTASVITGAATIMLAIFAVFALNGGTYTVRQTAVVLGSGILIDSTVVRLVLLPATMRIFGRANWWLPGWLERRLPHVEA